MALDDFAVHFDNAYEEIFQKVLVGKAIANMRFESVLSYGESVERVAYDVSAIRVRTVTRGSASTVDTLTDSSDTLTINLEKETCFFVSDGEMKQAGPLNPGTVIGGKVAHKVATDLDARILNQTLQAYLTFDEGDLTGAAVDGSPVMLNETTVPQLVTRLPAKLRRNNQVLSNMAFVVDSYVAADLSQYLLGKEFDVVNSIWRNGYVNGQVAGAELYVSENLTGEFTISNASLASTDYIIIGGVTFHAASSSPSGYGEFLSTLTDVFTHLGALINSPGTSTAGYTSALSETDIITVQDDLGLYCDTDAGSAGSLTVYGRGSGRLAITVSGLALAQNLIHCYYGKKGGIDVVIQDYKPVDIRRTADRRGQNIFASYLGGIKTFTDGSKKFLNVEVDVENS